MSQKVTTVEQLEQLITDLTGRIEALEQQVTKSSSSSQKEMTDEHARNVLIGDCKDLKHNEAAQKLGLSYGQVYSCRLEYTFRHIHKELVTKGFVNPWKKK